MNGEQQFQDQPGIPASPHASVAATDTCLEGFEFDSTSDVWRLSDRGGLHVKKIRAWYSSKLQEGLIGTLRHFARTKTMNTCRFTVVVLCHYANHFRPNGGISEWRVADLANYRAHVQAEFGYEGYMTKLRSFLKAWYALRFPGPTKDVIDALREMRLKNHEVGRAIRRMDSEDGPSTSPRCMD